MSKLPNYKLRYELLLRICNGIDASRIDVSEFARNNRASNMTIYNNIDAIERDYNAIF